LAKEPNVPNEHSHKQMDQLVQNTLQLVVAAWTKQYSKQEPIFTWPAELGDDFVAAVRPLKPIEAKVEFPTPANKELNVDYLRAYRDYVDRLVPDLAEDIGTVWLANKAAQPGMETTPGAVTPGQMQRGKQKAPIVLWEGSDQARLFGTHFDWSSQPDAAPTTLQMLYAQEDLWVYRALMSIIAATNRGARERHEAVVKSIETILIGRAAVGLAGQITRPAGAMGGGMMGPDMGSMYGGAGPMDASPMGSGSAAPMGSGSTGGMAAPSMPSPDSTMPMGGAVAASRDPGSYRYVDSNYTPLDAEKVRAALKSGSPQDAFLVVAKQMPIRMALIVDQRKLPKLLAECSNSYLPVEIRQVRVNRKGVGGGGGGGGMYGMPGGMPGGSMYPGAGMGLGSGMREGGDYSNDMGTAGMMPGYPGGGMPGAGMGEYNPGGYGTGLEAPKEGRVEISSTSPHDVPVEIYGIIYIYNPVDKQKLGLEQVPALTQTLQPTASPVGPTG
jgi:hypothetical protein